MRAEADGEEERQQRGKEADAVDGRCETSAEDDVGEVPQRVGRVQQDPPVADAPAP